MTVATLQLRIHVLARNIRYCNLPTSTLGLKFHVNGSLSVDVALTEWTLLRACCKKKTTARNVLFATNKLDCIIASFFRTVMLIKREWRVRELMPIKAQGNPPQVIFTCRYGTQFTRWRYHSRCVDVFWAEDKTRAKTHGLFTWANFLPEDWLFPDRQWSCKLESYQKIT